MKKRPIIRRHVYESLFNADIVLIVCEWEDFIEGARPMLVPDKLKTLEERSKGKLVDIWTLARQYPMDGGGSVIWARPNASVPTLVHEVVHAAHHLLADRATPLSEDTEETYAYLVERLYQGLLMTKK